MTQHHHTPPPDPMPLDPEERALAARLARLGPHGEPSPALDARVLAAAHAATSARATARAGTRGHGWRRARWPVGAGVAASVALAAAIAWQMRPLPAPVAPPRETAMRATAPAATATPLRRTVAQPSPLPPTPPDARVADAAAATEAAPAVAAARTSASAKSLAPPQEPPVVFDAPRAVDVEAPPPPPPSPPAPPAPTSAAADTASAAAAVAGEPAPSARAAKNAAQTQAQTQRTQDALPVFDADEADAPAADVPPATAASPAVRDAWLARIRELAAAGRGDEARASLAEFRRRYPAFAIPEDLRPLLPSASPAPATHPR